MKQEHAKDADDVHDQSNSANATKNLISAFAHRVVTNELMNIVFCYPHKP